MTVASAFEPDLVALTALCRKHQIVELAVFGSAARGELRPDSDVDLVATLSTGASWSLLDHQAIARELETLLGRRVDLFTRRAVERSPNALRRRAILDSLEVLYAA